MKKNANKALRRFQNLPVQLELCVRGRTRCSFFLLSVVLFSLVLSVCTLSQASPNIDDPWSLQFNNLTVDETLKELTRATGIDLYTNRFPQDRRLTKAYENLTLEQILRDIFRGENYTLVWNYGEEGLESIDITFFKNDGRPEGGPSYAVGPTVQTNLDDETPRPAFQQRPQALIGRGTQPANKLTARVRGALSGVQADRTDDMAEEDDDEDDNKKDAKDDESSEDEDDPNDEALETEDDED